jgi:hypothetical protein
MYAPRGFLSVGSNGLRLQRFQRKGHVIMHIFLDADGVLADFDKAGELLWGMPPREYEKKVGSVAFWRELQFTTDFYANLPLMPDAMELYNGVKHLDPTILTGCPRGGWAESQKVAWAARNFPGVPIITCMSAKKYTFGLPGDVLIDDWEQYRQLWEEMGGIFIHHKTALESLLKLSLIIEENSNVNRDPKLDESDPNSHAIHLASRTKGH